MRRISVQPRSNWAATVESQGFLFHTIDDQPYWDESACYCFNARQIDQVEQATYALNNMCIDAVQHVIDNDLFDLLQIPRQFVPWIKQSWEQDEFTVYGRFDLAYDGTNPPRLLEFNADTPTSLLEAAVIQWYWFKEVEAKPSAFSPELEAALAGSGGARFDQFNSLHERLVEAWGAYRAIVETRHRGAPGAFNPIVYFTGVEGMLEDFMTVSYLRDTATQAGLTSEYLDINRIGFDHRRGLFVDLNVRPIHNIFKLYPWEWMVREQFAPMLLKTRVHWLEAPWKMILSNKAILPILYELFGDSPFILPASFEPLEGPQIRKPILAREGANVAMIIGGKTILETEGPYGAPYVYQQLVPLPDHGGNLPIIGSWLVNGYACGMGIREDTSPITGNTSRFVPHLFVNNS